MYALLTKKKWFLVLAKDAPNQNCSSSVQIFFLPLKIRAGKVVYTIKHLLFTILKRKIARNIHSSPNYSYSSWHISPYYVLPLKKPKYLPVILLLDHK